MPWDQLSALSLPPISNTRSQAPCCFSALRSFSRPTWNSFGLARSRATVYKRLHTLLHALLPSTKLFVFSKIPGPSGHETERSLLSPKPWSFLLQNLSPQDQKPKATLGWLLALFSTHSHKMKSTSKIQQRLLYERRVQCDGAYHI